jgi:hypothetical protein
MLAHSFPYCSLSSSMSSSSGTPRRYSTLLHLRRREPNFARDSVDNSPTRVADLQHKMLARKRSEVRRSTDYDRRNDRRPVGCAARIHPGKLPSAYFQIQPAFQSSKKEMYSCIRWYIWIDPRCMNRPMRNQKRKHLGLQRRRKHRALLVTPIMQQKAQVQDGRNLRKWTHLIRTSPRAPVNCPSMNSSVFANWRDRNKGDLQETIGHATRICCHVQSLRSWMRKHLQYVQWSQIEAKRST